MNERIKELRKFFNLNQTEFGDRIGVKQSTITGYETGIREPLDSVILSICREFGVSEEWLRLGEGPMFPPQDENEELAGLFGSLYNKENAKKRIVAMGLRMTNEEAEAFEKFVTSIYNGLSTCNKK